MQAENVQHIINEYYTQLGLSPTTEHVATTIAAFLAHWLQAEPKAWQSAVRTTEHTIEIFGDVLRGEQPFSNTEAQAFNQKTIQALHQATHEFYYYVLRQQRHTKISMAEAEGHVIMDEGLIAMTFNGTDYIIQYYPCVVEIEDNENNFTTHDRITLLRKSKGKVTTKPSTKEINSVLEKLLSQVQL